METNIRNEMTLPVLQIRYLQCNRKIGGSVIAIAGLLVSLWANSILAVAYIQGSSYRYTDQPKYADKIIINASQVTHLIVTLTTTAGLLFGIKYNDRILLTPWLSTKIIEAIILFVCSILVGHIYPGFIGLTTVGIIVMLGALYISLCVWDTYKKMPAEPPSDENSTPEIQTIPNIPTIPTMLPDKPPSYDSFTNQATHVHS